MAGNGKCLSVDLPCSAEGRVSFKMLPGQQSVCEGIQGTHSQMGLQQAAVGIEGVGEDPGRGGSVLGRWRVPGGSHRGARGW